MSGNLKQDNPVSFSNTISALVQRWGGKTGLFFTYLHLSHDLTTGLLVALLPFIRQELGLNYLQSGLLTSGVALTSGLSQLLGGWIADRISRQKAVAIGLGGVGLCAIGVGLAPGYYWMLTVLIIQGVMAGWYHPAAAAGLSGSIEGKRRGKAFAVHMLGGTTGFLIGPTLGAVIAETLSWHFAFIILACPTIIAAVLAWTRLRIPVIVDTSKAGVSGTAAPNSWRGVIQVFRSLAGTVLLVMAVQLFVNPALSFVSLFLVDRHGLSTAAAAIWFSVVRLGGLAGSLFGGWLSDKWGRQRAVLLSLVLLGPTFYLMAHAPLGAWLVIAFICFGLLNAMREATMQTYLMDSSPAALRATVFGLYFGFGQEGSSLMQPALGRGMDLIGIYGVFNIISNFALGITVFALFAGRKVFRRQRLPSS